MPQTRVKRPPARKPAPPTTLADLRPDLANRRSHGSRNLAMVTEALHTVGAARSIVIDEDNLILAGNGVTEAAVAAGWTKVQVVEAEGDTLVAVRRRGLTAAQKRDLAIYDNRTAELAEWNLEQLAADLQNGEDLAAFFLPDELTALLGAGAAKPGLTDPDAVPEPRPTTIQLGDLFALGAHRLLCGDSTAAPDVARVLDGATPALMVTDPPYGVDYDPGWRVRGGLQRKGAEGRVTNDHTADWTEAWHLSPASVAYVWHAGLYGGVVAASLAAAGFQIRSQIVWAKPAFVIGRGHYHWQHEPCWYAVRKQATAQWIGDRKQSTLWAIPNMHRTRGDVDDGKTEHATQKPVECMARPMRHHEAAEVYEPFSGSGTTLIACEQLARRCFAVDVEPTYCQLAIDRWEAFTGQQARQL
jgi:DNA modification methylase